MNPEIIFEDSVLLVLDKPAGLVCNRSITQQGKTLQDWMEERYRQQWSNMSEKGQIVSEEERYFLERLGLVHRLDKETAGVMVMAKTAEAFGKLLAQFKERQVFKEYLALTHGKWEPMTGEIDLPIARSRANRQMMSIREDGRASQTKYCVLAEWKRLKVEAGKTKKIKEQGYSGFSLVRFVPKTGRMHQIRVHAKQLGHPLVGDPIYTGRKRSREDRKWCGSIMLRADKLSVIHPVTGERREFWSKNREIEQVCQLLC